MKRFTEASKWGDVWFRKLEPRLKLFWGWLCDNCDSAGVIDPDLELASFQIGMPITEEDWRYFDGRIEKINGSKRWIIKFIPFQYGTLTEVCRAHIPVIRLVDKYGLSDRLSIPYPKAMDSHKEQDKDKEQVKEGGVKRGDSLPTSPEATAIAQLFSRRLTTAWSQKEIEAFKSAMKREAITVDGVSLISEYYDSERAKGGSGIHRRDLCTFLNNYDGELDRANAFKANPKAHDRTNGNKPISPRNIGHNAGVSYAGFKQAPSSEPDPFADPPSPV